LKLIEICPLARAKYAASGREIDRNMLREINRNRGFTLIEVVVASAILVALMGPYLATYYSLLKSTQQSKGFSLAMNACLNKMNEISAHNFSLVPVNYSSGGIPGDTFNLPGFASGNGIGKITITDRADLYGGGETQATAAANWGARDHFDGLVYDDRMWIMGGRVVLKNDVWYSTDGVNWTQATAAADWSPRYNPSCVVYDNKMWVMGGWDGACKNDVWYSTDGVDWTQATAAAPWPARIGAGTALVYDNKIWIMGGCDDVTNFNDVWYSTDGVNWTQATAAAAWPPRQDHRTIAYDGKMWIAGGGVSEGGTEYNDVWYSTDGVNWTQATAAADWSPREDFGFIAYDDRMWVIGGNFGGTEVWYSADGASWTQATAAAAWGARQDFAAAVYDNKMWLFGGKSATQKNDVWYSTGYGRLLEVVIRAGFKTGGRITGADDTNDNGTIEADEIEPGTPVRIRAFISKKKGEIFLGRP